MRILKLNKTKWVIVGFVSVCWFLIRVIPKPTRAYYPCQRVTFPIASTFVIWLISLFASLKISAKSKRIFHKRKSRFAGIAVFLIMLILQPGTNYQYVNGFQLNFNNSKEFIPEDGANNPLGKSFGIFPGRVVWHHNPEATNWDRKNGFFWDETHTNYNEVHKMLSQSIDAVTGATNNTYSWMLLFEDFNRRNNKRDTGYISGEKLAIKLNLSNSDTHGSIYDNHSMTSPQLILSLIRQLVYEAHVPDSCITIYDISQQIPAIIYNPLHTEFPSLNFVDEKGGRGRRIYKTDSLTELKWSKKLTLEDGGGNPTFLPRCVTDADYVINVGILKGHNMAGITLCGKNHVGTIISSNPDRPELSSPRAAGIHPYATVHYFDYWNLQENPMGSYTTLVDLIGHKDLGNKTLLFIVDGLYASKAQNGEASIPNKWFMTPFNNDWTSSVFVAQDNVALESVCLDFLRSEPTMVNVYGSVDNYLHESALASNPPSGIFYDPEGDGTKLSGLGIHEHWNNYTDKQYTGNLIPGKGIELVNLSNYIIEPLTFSLPPDKYESAISLEVSTATPNVQIYYTVDGTYPDTTKYLYNGAISIEKTTTISAIAYRDEYTSSEVLTGYFAINTATDITIEDHIIFTVYPTYVNDKLYIRSNHNTELPDIKIYNIEGVMINKFQIHQSNFSNNWIINTSNIVKGPYLIQIKSDNKIVTRQFIKQ